MGTSLFPKVTSSCSITVTSVPRPFAPGNDHLISDFTKLCMERKQKVMLPVRTSEEERVPFKIK
jgi:hypothetical protein